MKRNEQRKGWTGADWFCLALAIGLAVWWLNGCAPMGYTASAVGAGRTELKLIALEKRVRVLEEKVDERTF